MVNWYGIFVRNTGLKGNFVEEKMNEDRKEAKEFSGLKLFIWLAVGIFIFYTIGS